MQIIICRKIKIIFSGHISRSIITELRNAYSFKNLEIYWQITFFIFYLLILEKEDERGGEREREMCCSTNLCIHTLMIVCGLPRD